MGDNSSNRYILWAEDDHTTRKAISMILTNHFTNHRILSCEHGEAGKSYIDRLLARGAKIDLILSDEVMTGSTTGSELLLYKREILPYTARILITGQPTVNEDVVIRCLREEIDDFIRKPAKGSELIFRINNALEKQRKRDERRQILQELATKNKKLEALDQAKTKFMIVASHELLTPLTSLMANLEFLSSCSPSSQLTAAQESVQQLHHLIREIIDMLLIESELMEYNRTELCLSSFLTEMLAHFAPSTTERNITLTYQANDPIWIHGDREALGKVFQHIIGNAIKYTPEHGTIQVSLTPGPNTAQIMIRDSGIGIPSDQLNLIFESFYSLENPMLHSSGKTNYLSGGTGLGLAISRGIIKAHQGRIWAESDSNQAGSTFYIELPLSQRAGVDQEKTI